MKEYCRVILRSMKRHRRPQADRGSTPKNLPKTKSYPVLVLEQTRDEYTPGHHTMSHSPSHIAFVALFIEPQRCKKTTPARGFHSERDGQPILAAI